MDEILLKLDFDQAGLIAMAMGEGVAQCDVGQSCSVCISRREIIHQIVDAGHRAGDIALAVSREGISPYDYFIEMFR